jgi:uncharacterized iron-regulated protein
MKNLFLKLIFVFILFFPVSCAKRISPSWILEISGISPPIGQEEIFRIPEGDRITFREILDDLHQARVIFVGETHDQIEHHRIQLKVLRGVLERGKEVVVAMEMFERSQQPLLDRWSQGRFTEEEFLREVNWKATWGMDYQLYKGILDEARDHRLKILGLNVPRELVRKVAQSGMEGLSVEDKKRLPDMDLTDQKHRAHIESVYKDHEGGLARDFEKFYQAQVLWDEGMAEHLSEFLTSPEGQGKTVIFLAGNGHIIFHFGIPNRFYRRTPILYKTIVLKEWRMGIEDDSMLTKRSLPLADYLWITHPTPPEKKRPRIGLVLKEETDGVRIELIIPKSPAEKAGLLPGDRILSVDGNEIKRLRDLHDAVARKGHGKDFTITALREGLKKELRVTLPSSPQ